MDEKKELSVTPETIEEKKPPFRFLVNRYGHRRAWWRMFLYTLAFSAINLVMFLILDVLSVTPGKKGQPIDMFSLRITIQNLIINISLVLAAYIFLKWIDHRPFRLLGFDFSVYSMSEFWGGFGIGFLLYAVAFFITWVSGSIEVTSVQLSLRTFQYTGYYLFGFLVAAALEEFLLRGYLFQVFTENTRQWVSTLVFSFIFSALHIPNPDYGFLSFINILIFGIIFSLIYLKTRSLWTVIGLHTAWNWTQGSIFGMKVSGININNPILETKLTGSELLNGGAFGTESSIFFTVIGAVFIWFILKKNWFKPSVNKAHLWNHYPQGYQLDSIESQKTEEAPIADAAVSVEPVV